VQRNDRPVVPRYRGRGRPATISQARIVDTAVRLGLDTLSMQAVADELGVTAPALYSHVSGREELIHLVRQALRERMEAFSSSAQGWRAWLTDFARTVRRDLAGSAATLMFERGPGTSKRLAVGEPGLRLLIAEGFTPAEAGYAVWLVFRVAITAAARERGPLEHHVDATGRILAGERRDLRATRSVQAALAREHVHDTLDFDLEIVLDGIARLLARRRRSTS
jgi:AcrR family transcriptional regulator